MGWLSLLKLLVSVSIKVLEINQQKELIEAGEAKALLKGLQDAQKRINKANSSRKSATDKFDSDNGMPDDNDPNLRD